MKLSIILTTYNRYELLKACLKSIGDQSCANWELLIGDDNSSDPRVGELCRLFLAKQNELWQTKMGGYYRTNVTREMRKYNCRFSVVINWLYPMATGDLVMYLCDDNELDRRAVETIINHFQDHPDHNCGYMGQVMWDADTRTGARCSPREDHRGDPEYGQPLPTAFCRVDHAQVIHRRQFHVAWTEDSSAWHHADGLMFDELIRQAGPLYPVGNVKTDALCIYKVTDTSICRVPVDRALARLEKIAELSDPT